MKDHLKILQRWLFHDLILQIDFTIETLTILFILYDKEHSTRMGRNCASSANTSSKNQLTNLKIQIELKSSA